MQNIIDIKNRSESIKETAKITKAMELISTAKLRKGHKKYINNTVYFDKVRSTIKDILMHKGGDISHPYLKKGEGDKTAYIVIASDKGLAGDYNHRVLKLAMEEIPRNKQSYLLIIGHMAKEFFINRGIQPDVEYLHASQNPTLEDARIITADLMEMFEKGLIDSIEIVYTRMVSAAVQEPIVLHLLPLLIEDFYDVEEAHDYNVILDFEPSAEEVINILVPQYILGVVYSCLIQSTYSEHYERMRTMHNATKNANELITKLELEYNRARQEGVTTEIIEISTASLYHK